MLADIEKRLKETAAAIQRRTALTEVVKTEEEKLYGLNQELLEAQQRMTKWEVRLRRLEGKTLLAGWHHLLGNREEQVAKARWELERLEKQVAEKQKAVQETEAFLLKLKSQLDHLSGLEKTYEALLLEKERALLSSGPLGEELRKIIRREREARAEMWEINNVINLGMDLRDQYERVISELIHAGYAGVVDMRSGPAGPGPMGMGPGGMRPASMGPAGMGPGISGFGFSDVAGAYKYLKIQEACNLLRGTEETLLEFQERLQDLQDMVELNAGPNLEIHPIIVTDILLDSQVAAFWMQTKIMDAIDSLRQQNARIHAVLNRLRQRYQQLEQEIASLQTRRREILTSSFL